MYGIFLCSYSKQQVEIIRLKQPKTKVLVKQESKNIILFPNPANAIVNINSKQDAIKQIEVVDMMGKTIKTITVNNQKNTQFNTTGLQKGLFLVKIITANNAVTTQKLIVE